GAFPLVNLHEVIRQVLPGPPLLRWAAKSPGACSASPRAQTREHPSRGGRQAPHAGSFRPITAPDRWTSSHRRGDQTKQTASATVPVSYQAYVQLKLEYPRPLLRIPSASTPSA